MVRSSASATGVTIGIFSPDAQYCSNHRQASTCAMFRFSMLEPPKPFPLDAIEGRRRLKLFLFDGI
jgi:hypothetical protein